MRADQSPEQQPEEVQQVATRRSKRNIGVEDAKVPVGGEN
jgi:hypothetical protein